MKKFICTILFLSLPLSLSAKDETFELVGDNACKLYDSLAIDPDQIPNDVHGYSLFQKVVPGLSCTFWMSTWQEVKAGCGCIFKRDLSEYQMQEIYRMLAVYETPVDDGNPKIYTKEVGELVFTRMLYQEGHEFQTFYEFAFLMGE